jgi:hypothetical protein
MMFNFLPLVGNQSRKERPFIQLRMEMMNIFFHARASAQLLGYLTDTQLLVHLYSSGNERRLLSLSTSFTSECDCCFQAPGGAQRAGYPLYGPGECF